MRYLKLFEDLNSDTFILDLRDILLDLKDIGFNTSVYKPYMDNTIKIDINNRGGNFKMSQDLIDALFRISNYVIDNGYKCDILSNLGRLYIMNDRVVSASGVISKNGYHSFTVINILLT
jgi:hypothetical protein